eukprot:gene21912-28954_t
MVQMDEQVAQVAELMLSQAGPGGRFEGASLLILGDHGQTLGGDHGGGSQEETDSVLIGFNMAACYAQVYGAFDRLHHLTHHDPAARLDCTRRVPQLDFAVGMSLMLGLPIPFGSLGRLDPDWWWWAASSEPSRSPFLGSGTETKTKSGAEPGGHSGKSDAEPGGHSGKSGADPGGHSGNNVKMLASYVDALYINVQQVHLYLTTYASHASLPTREMATCNSLFQAAQASYAPLRDKIRAVLHPLATPHSDRVDVADHTVASTDRQADMADLMAASADLLLYLESTALMARSKFTRFHLGLMALGCALSVLSVLLHVLLLCWLWRWHIPNIPITHLVVLATSLFHSFSLFGVTWIMGEGRMLAFCLAGALLLIWTKSIISLIVSCRSAGSVLQNMRSTSVRDKVQGVGSLTLNPTGSKLVNGLTGRQAFGVEGNVGPEVGSDSGNVGPEVGSDSAHLSSPHKIRLALKAAEQYLDMAQHEIGDRCEQSAPHCVDHIRSNGQIRSDRQIRFDHHIRSDGQIRSDLNTEEGNVYATALWVRSPMTWIKVLIPGLIALLSHCLVLIPGLIALLSHFLVSRLGLIDRYGKDPHDKSNPTDDLFTTVADLDASSAPFAQVLYSNLPKVATVLLPLAMAPLTLALGYGQLSSLCSRSSAYRQPRRWWSRMKLGVLGGVVLLQYSALAIWWLLRMWPGTQDVNLSFLMDSALSLTSHTGLSELLDLFPAELHPWRCLVQPITALPLRLLLPRFICSSSVLALIFCAAQAGLQPSSHGLGAGEGTRVGTGKGTGAGTRTATWAGSREGVETGTGRGMEAQTGTGEGMGAEHGAEPGHMIATHDRAVGTGSRRGVGAQTGSGEGMEVELGADPGEQIVTLDRAVCKEGTEDNSQCMEDRLVLQFAVVAVLCAPIALLLGFKGPQTVMLALAMGSSIICMLTMQWRLDQGVARLQRTAGQLAPSGRGAVTPSYDDLASPVVWSLAGASLFFSSSHFCEFSGLQYSSAFIGFDDVNCTTKPSAATATANTANTTGTASTSASRRRLLLVHLVCYSLVRTTTLCISILCSAILRHNIVVWAIIAPKLVFELCFVAVSDVGLLLGCWIGF